MSDSRLSHSQYEVLTRAFNPICSGCLDMNPSIFDRRAVTWANSYPKLSPQKVVLGFENQCSSCMLIYKAFQSIGLDLHTLHDPQYLSLHLTEENDSLLAMAVLDEKEVLQVELYTVPDKPFSPWTIVKCKTTPSGNTGSKLSFHNILKWIKHCEMNHKNCSTEHGVALPTRVLDLGKSNNSIRLIETRGLSGIYICLSHCWGQSSTILCTSRTYNSYMENIPWDSLSLLFQDTIEICRLLKVQYLWIDKLCIIQQDKDDWAREGSRMAQIFENSFLTIAAAVSHNDMESLFYKDYRHLPSSESFTSSMKDGSPYTIKYRIPFNDHLTTDGDSRPNSGKYPLMSRAWVFQERLLAPRIVYFGEELNWECKEASACECSGEGRKEHGHHVALSSDHSIETSHAQWQNMVENFTWLQLSFEEDRLPAFSGLAQRYQSRLKSEYLAGLWRTHLVADLMWFPHHIEAKAFSTTRPRKWRAPSWSWASVDGPILFVKDYKISQAETCSESGTRLGEIKSITCLVTIISAECTASSLDPTGTVANGRLVIKGSGRPAVLKHREEGHGVHHFTVRHIGIDSVSIRSNFSVDGHEANVDYDLIEHGLMRSNSLMSIYCLRLASMSFLEELYLVDEGEGECILSPTFRTWSLLLHSADGKIFERIGFLVSDHPGNDDPFRNILHECTLTIV